MSAQGLKDRWTDARLRAQAGWRWWAGELAAAMPTGLRNALSPSAPVVAIDLQDKTVILRRFANGDVREIARLPRADFTAENLRAVLQPYLAMPWFLRDAFALRLPDSMALWRNLSLPLAARRNVASLLNHELERQSPLDRGEVYHDHKILRADRRAGRVEFVWRIARRKAVDDAIAVCRQAGVPLAIVAFASDETPPDGGNFPVESRAALLMRLRKALVPTLLALVFVLGAAALASGYSRNEQAADALTAQVERARVEARIASRLRRDIVNAQQVTGYLVGQKKSLMTARVLAETTRILPNGSWLTELEYQGGEVHIQGLSNSAASLIALFDSSPLFTAAEFRAPLVQAQGPGLERFDLSFKIRKGAL
ncbi:MAG TPA: PilN domain-containing protein [Rhizomicrobium sp.]|jgi:general secretion pathway protein L